MWTLGLNLVGIRNGVPNKAQLYTNSVLQDCPPGSGSMPTFSNSRKQGQSKKEKQANSIAKYRTSHVGN